MMCFLGYDISTYIVAYDIMAARASGKARKMNSKTDGLALGHLLAAKVLVGRVGSLEAARSAVASLAKLVG